MTDTLELLRHEREVLKLLSEGRSLKEIASLRNVSFGGLKAQIWRIQVKLGVQSAQEAIAKARSLEIL